MNILESYRVAFSEDNIKSIHKKHLEKIMPTKLYELFEFYANIDNKDYKFTNGNNIIFWRNGYGLRVIKDGKTEKDLTQEDMYNIEYYNICVDILEEKLPKRTKEDIVKELGYDFELI